MSRHVTLYSEISLNNHLTKAASLLIAVITIIYMYMYSTPTSTPPPPPHTHTHTHSLKCEQLILHVLVIILRIQLLIHIHYAKFHLPLTSTGPNLFFSQLRKCDLPDPRKGMAL